MNVLLIHALNNAEADCSYTATALIFPNADNHKSYSEWIFTQCCCILEYLRIPVHPLIYQRDYPPTHYTCCQTEPTPAEGEHIQLHGATVEPFMFGLYEW